jgi:DNA-binding NarL/FixJ family response regulator
MLKILIADDSDILRAVVRSTLQEERFVEVIGEASSFAETIQKAVELNPDIVLLDLRMPDQYRFSPDTVRTSLSGVHTIAMSIANDEESKELANRYGAATLLDKLNLYDQMIPALRQAGHSAQTGPISENRP